MGSQKDYTDFTSINGETSNVVANLPAATSTPTAKPMVVLPQKHVM